MYNPRYKHKSPEIAREDFMKTYQDWLKVADKSEEERMTFIYGAINEHKSSLDFQNANIGEDYFKAENTTIRTYEKVLYNALGQAVPDLVSSNHKLASRFFYRDVTQANAVLLGNGIKWIHCFPIYFP